MIEPKVNQSIATPPKEKPEADWGSSMDSSKNRKEEGSGSRHGRRSVHDKKGGSSSKHSKRESASGKKKPHDKKTHKKQQDAEDKEKPANDESVNHHNSQSTIPDYHWEDHSDRRQSIKKEGSTRKSKRFSLLKDEEPEDGVFDVGLEEEPLALQGLPRTPQGLPKTPRQNDDSMHQSFHKWDAEEQLEEDEKELDKAEDQALQTSPKPTGRPVLSQQLSVGRLSPTAPPSVPRTPDPNSPSKRRTSLNTLSLGSPVPTGLQHSRSSFVPPFLVEASDEEEEEDEQGNRSFSQLKTNNLHNSVPASASGQWDLTDELVPEAMGMDEGIPQINQKRRSSIL